MGPVRSIKGGNATVRKRAFGFFRICTLLNSLVSAFGRLYSKLFCICTLLNSRVSAFGRLRSKRILKTEFLQADRQVRYVDAKMIRSRSATDFCVG